MRTCEGASMSWDQWRVPAGFLAGLVLLGGLIVFTTLSLTGLPLTSPILAVLFVLAFNLYLINGVLRTFWVFVLATVAILAFPASLEAFGFIPAFFVHLLSSPDTLLSDGEIVAGAMALVVLMGSYIRPEKMVEQGGLLNVFGAFFWAGVASLLLAFYGAESLKGAAVLYCYAAFSLFMFYSYARKRPDRRLMAMWMAIQPFDAKYGGHLAGRLPAILLVTLAYAYIVITFAGVYYYFDNCDSGGFPCRIVDYHRFVPPTGDTKETCWSFNIIPPQADSVEGHPNLCLNHRQANPLTIKAFLPYLYFSMVTSTTVGYGDISPVSVSAVWIVICHHLLAIILLIGVVTQLANFSSESSRTTTPRG
jgi:hypothetical protein